MNDSFNDSDEDAYSDSELGIHDVRGSTCPITICSRNMRYHRLFAHIRDRHRTWEHPRPSPRTNDELFCIRLCYNRRSDAGPLLSFSSSVTPHSWISDILKFDNQKFLFHVTEENNEMRHWITSFAPAKETRNNYVAHVVFGKPDGTIPPVEQMRQWRGAVREFHGDGGDYLESSKFVIPNMELWNELAYVNEYRNAPKDQLDTPLPYVHWNMRIRLVNSPLLHAQLRLLDNGEVVRGTCFRNFWNHRTRLFRSRKYHWIPAPAAAARRLALLRDRWAAAQPPRPTSRSTSPVTPEKLEDDDMFLLRLDDDSPLTHFDAVILLKLDGRQGLDEEEFQELSDAWKLFNLFSAKFEEIQRGPQGNPIPETSSRPDRTPAVVIEEAFFALELEPGNPSDDGRMILEKVSRREDLDYEDFMEVKAALELFRLWQKYVLGISPLPTAAAQ